jgi:hypothetical protein
VDPAQLERWMERLRAEAPGEAAMLPMGSAEPELLTWWYRRAIASGCARAIGWDPPYADKLGGRAWAAARAEVRRTVRDLGPVRHRMVHRHVHADGSGYTWTNDADGARVVWLFADRPLPDGRPDRAGQVYVVESRAATGSRSTTGSRRRDRGRGAGR